MRNYFCKYIPPRPDFMDTLTAEEAGLLMDQRAWQSDLFSRNVIVACGPVLDPTGSYGMAIYSIPESHDIAAITVLDPMVQAKIGHYEHFPLLELTACSGSHAAI
ncbi:hypothetical protein [Sphingomonas sp. Leaf343]|uniref:hypothetical protein n=1 Tax=Sphingomonas sp. Leaf343 TaxID=1736345 RepID=UPI0006FFC454|nr:hypothetical protein [Sphingomonas sp. Leaf343]KQR83917.1 hypothetical protein ASG07_04640 [Sphingomonas sp. Leaf343]